MNSPRTTLAVITGGGSPLAQKRWAPPVRMSVAVPAPDQRSMKALVAVTVLHAVAILCVLYPWASTPSQQPVLSFTVTMMDLSSSPNSISSASSSASAQTQKQQTKNSEAITPTTHAAKAKKMVKPVTAPTPKTNAPLAHSSQEQTAVLAPTTPAQFDAAYLNNPPPSYPPMSRRLGEQGKVLLSVYVDESGQPKDIQLQQSSGFTRLDAAAEDSVRRWRFAAAKQGEKLIASWVNVPVKFVLE